MKDGDVILLENSRFYPEEEKNNAGFAKEIAANADMFVNDAFGEYRYRCCHSSIYSVT